MHVLYESPNDEISEKSWKDWWRTRLYSLKGQRGHTARNEMLSRVCVIFELSKCDLQVIGDSRVSGRYVLVCPSEWRDLKIQNNVNCMMQQQYSNWSYRRPVFWRGRRTAMESLSRLGVLWWTSLPLVEPRRIKPSDRNRLTWMTVGWVECSWQFVMHFVPCLSED